MLDRTTKNTLQETSSIFLIITQGNGISLKKILYAEFMFLVVPCSKCLFHGGRLLRVSLFGWLWGNVRIYFAWGIIFFLFLSHWSLFFDLRGSGDCFLLGGGWGLGKGWVDGKVGSFAGVNFFERRGSVGVAFFSAWNWTPHWTKCKEQQFMDQPRYNRIKFHNRNLMFAHIKMYIRSSLQHWVHKQLEHSDKWQSILKLIISIIIILGA